MIGQPCELGFAPPSLLEPERGQAFGRRFAPSPVCGFAPCPGGCPASRHVPQQPLQAAVRQEQASLPEQAAHFLPLPKQQP